METLQQLPKVIIARGVVLALGVRIVRLRLLNGSDLVLTDVLYMPTFLVNLFSRVILYTLGGTIYGKTFILRNRLKKVISDIDILLNFITYSARKAPYSP
jgi:hypothetical protein